MGDEFQGKTVKTLPSLLNVAKKEKKWEQLKKSRLWQLDTLSLRSTHGKGTLKKSKERNKVKHQVKMKEKKDKMRRIKENEIR